MTMTSIAGPIELCGIPLEHPIINASGTFDAIAARRAFGDEVLERFPFSAYVSKTITPAVRLSRCRRLAPSRILSVLCLVRS